MNRPSYVPHYLAAVVSVFMATLFGIIELYIRQPDFDRGFLAQLMILFGAVSTPILTGLAAERSRQEKADAILDKTDQAAVKAEEAKQAATQNTRELKHNTELTSDIKKQLDEQTKEP